ncbi:MAG: nuclear transport factor 2 family protein [Mariprofundaceae bacterium]|nr:nuclear transport factor 2 family protein [Mariprofundaceae bacterium]
MALSACQQVDKVDIAEVLDARNDAVSSKNITAYGALLINDYHFQKHTKSDILYAMQEIFERFQVIQMQTHNRHIDVLDETHAICNQSYTFKVKADNEWRSIVQQEQLQLTKQNDAWKISSGL